MAGTWLRIDRVARQLRDRFVGRHLRMSSSGEVHYVRLVPWLLAERIPGPACGSATGSLAPTEWEATNDPVTCLHCLWVGAPVEHTEPVDMPQLALFDPAA